MSGNPIDEQDERAAVEAAARRTRQLQRKQDQEDVKALLESEAARRVLWRFLQDSGQGRSVYRDTAHAMAHAAGWQDAANWWLNEIRTHAPEREAQMRAEARRRDRQQEQTNDD